MSIKRYLVAGAAGSTGSATVKYLREQEAEVLAVVHQDDERAGQLRAIGARTIVGELLQFESVRSALEGVSAAYFVYPVDAGLIQATTYFAQAAKETGLSLVVNMSQISARREAKSHAAQDHWMAERIFDWSGVPVTHLRPTLFAEWILYWAPFFKKGVDLRLPFTTGRHAPVAADDQGRLIASILLHPEGHVGETYSLYGPVEMTFAEIARKVGRAIAKPIEYQTIDVPSLKEITINEHHRNPGDVFWQHLAEIAVDHNNGIFAGTNNLIESVTGKSPMTLDTFIQIHKAELAE